jgi:hypothetical protein
MTIDLRSTMIGIIDCEAPFIADKSLLFDNITIFNEIKNSPYKFHSNINEELVDIHILQLDNSYYCVDNEINRITAKISYKVEQNDIIGTFVYQIGVFLETRRYIGYNFSSKIIFDYILKEYNSLMLDCDRTWLGDYYWKYCIEDAFENKLNVYLYDLLHNSLEQLYTIPDDNIFSGDNIKSENFKRIVISNNKLG